MDIKHIFLSEYIFKELKIDAKIGRIDFKPFLIIFKFLPHPFHQLLQSRF